MGLIIRSLAARWIDIRSSVESVDIRSSVESESWASAGLQRKKIKLRWNIRQMRDNLNFVLQRYDAVLMSHFKPWLRSSWTTSR
jgi:hypothetical protein